MFGLLGVLVKTVVTSFITLALLWIFGIFIGLDVSRLLEFRGFVVFLVAVFYASDWLHKRKMKRKVISKILGIKDED